MTSHKFVGFLTPFPLCHTKMTVLLRPSYMASQKGQTTPLPPARNKCKILQSKMHLYFYWARLALKFQKFIFLTVQKQVKSGFRHLLYVRQFTLRNKKSHKSYCQGGDKCLPCPLPLGTSTCSIADKSPIWGVIWI